MNIQGVLRRTVGSVSSAHYLRSGALTSVIQVSVVGAQGQDKASAHWQPLLLPQGPWEELWAGHGRLVGSACPDDLGQGPPS